jgi:CBS domain containing-hemolysin-like protein
VWLNNAANWCVAKVGVEASDTLSTGQDSAALRHLVEHSAEVGALEDGYARGISGALALETMTIGDIVRRGPLTVVPPSASVADVQELSRTSGHLRILVDRAPGGTTPQPDLVGMVHVRDTLSHASETPVASLLRPVSAVAATTTVYDALASMRRGRNHLMLVTDDGDVVGVITMADLLQRLFPVES